MVEKTSAFVGQQRGETQNQDKGASEMPGPKHKSSPEDFQTLEDRAGTPGQPGLLSPLGFSHSHSAPGDALLPPSQGKKVGALLAPASSRSSSLQGKAAGGCVVLLRPGHCPSLGQLRDQLPVDVFQCKTVRLWRQKQGPAD